LKPGLEVKYALEEAEKKGIETKFLGAELCQVTWQRLVHETRMNLPRYIFKRLEYTRLQFWGTEREAAVSRLHNSEPAQFSEKCLDPYLVNWFIQSLDIFFPKFKRIFVDMRDEDLFKAID
jgi:pheromone shutdown protein TraB